MLDHPDLDIAPDDADVSVVPNPPASSDAPPADDPYGLRALTFADLPNQPGDGVFGGVMRQMAANGHPGLQAWAADDAAVRGGADPLSGLWNVNGSRAPQSDDTPSHTASVPTSSPGTQTSAISSLPFDKVATIAAANNLSEGVIPNNVLVAIAYDESRFNPQARSPTTSATGLMQVIGGKNGLGDVNNQYDKTYTPQDLYDPAKNMQAASLLLALKDQYAGATGDLHKALSLYRGADDAAVNTAYADRILKAAALLDANPKDPYQALRQAIPDGSTGPRRRSNP